MSEYQPIRTKQELDLLDNEEVVAGYLDGLKGSSQPGSDKSKSFWHGWRNGRVDGGFAAIDCDQRRLAREIVGTYKGLN